MQLPKISQRTTLLVLGLWLAFLISRVFQLDQLPIAFAHDEIYYAAESKAVQLSASDLTGQWHPWYLSAASSLYAELPGTVMAIGQLIWPNSLASARLSSAIVGSVFPFLLASLAYYFWRKPSAFWLTALIAGVNPWLFQFSRMSFDAIFSLFFYSVALNLLLWLKGWQKLWAILPLALGFYQYQGLKLIMVPLVLSVLALQLYQLWTQSKKKFTVQLPKLAPTLVISVFAILLFASFVLRLKNQSSISRVNDLIFFKSDIQQQVNDQRRLSLPSPMTLIANNKVSWVAATFIQKYFSAFDISQLFAKGEPYRNPFSVFTFGMFYWLDLMLLVIGFFVLWQKKETQPYAFLLLSWLLLAPLPVAINSIDNWLMFRAAWFIPTILIVSGIGASWLWENQRRLAYPVAGIYVIFVSIFGYHYWYRYPLYSSVDRGFSERIVSSYIARVADQHPVIFTANESTFVFEAYLVYRHLITPANLPAIHQAFQTKHFQLGNTEIDTRCFDPSPTDPNQVVITEASNSRCDENNPDLGKSDKQTTTIASLIDSGAIYRVYNDPLCTQFNLRSFARVESRQQLNIEQLSNQQFCETYFSYQN